jgi:hypothetical protein
LGLPTGMTMTQDNQEPPAGHSIDAVKTWHYLRLSMVALVLGLAAAVLYEHAQAHCWQTSISAYWYTPARGYFVGMLIGMSVCMICLRGSGEAEDILLNFAGMFAPVVALVPTAPEKQMPCMQIQSALQERPASIANNGTALFAVGGVAIVLVLVISHRNRMTGYEARAAIGAFALWLAALLVFVFARDAFDDVAHLTAASAMFFCIIVVACINARETKPHRRFVNYRNAYMATAVGMVASVAATAIFALAGGWSHLTIGIEVALIVLFAIFWVLQTIELRDYGLRPAAPVAGERATNKRSS